MYTRVERNAFEDCRWSGFFYPRSFCRKLKYRCYKNFKWCVCNEIDRKFSSFSSSDKSSDQFLLYILSIWKLTSIFLPQKPGTRLRELFPWSPAYTRFVPWYCTPKNQITVMMRFENSNRCAALFFYCVPWKRYLRRSSVTVFTAYLCVNKIEDKPRCPCRYFILT